MQLGTYVYGSAAIALLLLSSAANAADLGAVALDLNELGEIRAGEVPQTTIATRQNVDASSSNNNISADTVRTGDINFSQSSLSNFSGVGNVMVNTGNNNILQGTMSVTVVSMAPP